MFHFDLDVRESKVNRVPDGSTYPDQKLAPSSLCKKLVVQKHNLNLGLVMASSGWQSRFE
jgi:hypothetical protein